MPTLIEHKLQYLRSFGVDPPHGTRGGGSYVHTGVSASRVGTGDHDSTAKGVDVVVRGRSRELHDVPLFLVVRGLQERLAHAAVVSQEDQPCGGIDQGKNRTLNPKP